MKNGSRWAAAAAVGLWAASAAPGFAQSAMTVPERVQTVLDAHQQDAFYTETPALNTTPQAKRRAAVTYLDDAISLLNMAEAQLRTGATREATLSLMAADGKVSDAFLYTYLDRSFADRLGPMSLGTGMALAALEQHDTQLALAAVSRLRPALASLYDTQLGQLGGGGGGIGGYEPIGPQPIR